MNSKVVYQQTERSRPDLSVAIIITTLVLAGTSGAQQKIAQSSDRNNEEAVIQQLIEKYARSIDAADASLAAEVWLDSPEVSFIHPLGHEHGFDQIKRNIYQHLMGETFRERKLTPHDLSVHVHGNSAWAEFDWDFAARFRKDGSSIVTHGRETQVYWKTPTGWRLVHVHYSASPGGGSGGDGQLR